MRWFFLFLSFLVGGCHDEFDFATLSDPKIAFCEKVKPAIVFGKSTCGFCKMAMAELQKRGFEPRFVELDPRGSATRITELIAANAELQGLLQKQNIDGRTLFSVPQIFWGKTYVGGYDVLKEKVLEPLDRLLRSPEKVLQAVQQCRAR